MADAMTAGRRHSPTLLWATTERGPPPEGIVGVLPVRPILSEARKDLLHLDSDKPMALGARALQDAARLVRELQECLAVRTLGRQPAL